MAGGKMFRVVKAKRIRPAVRREVNRQIQSNIETKQANMVGVPNIGTTPTDLLISQVAVGDSQNNRTGNQVFITGLRFRFIVYPNPNTIISTNIYLYSVRIILYIGKDNSTLSGITTNSLVDQDRYTVLHDKKYPVNFHNTPLVERVISKKFNRGVKKGIRMTYSGTGAGNAQKNDLKIYLVSDASLASEQPILEYMSRLYYKDA